MDRFFIKTNLLVLFFFLFVGCRITSELYTWDSGSAFFEVQKLFDNERFPNVVVAPDGTIMTTWGSKDFRIRRSLNGGKTWEPPRTLANPGFHGGGTIVDENTGDVFVFIEEGHPISPLKVFRSSDIGLSWNEVDIKIIPNSMGHIPSMHMNEHGITIQNGKYKGRLIRPTRYYGGGNDRKFWDDHYTNAMFSDDHGLTWQTSEPFPAKGTG